MADLPLKFRVPSPDRDCTCQNYYASGSDEAAALKKKIDELETELAFQKRMTARKLELAGRRKRGQ